MTTKTGSDEFYDLADGCVRDGRYEEAIEIYQKLIATRPDDDSLVFSLAWAYRDSGRNEDAINCFEMLLERELARKIFTGFAYDELVRLFREKGDYEKLVALCEKAVGAQPNDPALLETLGNACLRAGRVDRAVEVFERLSRRESDSAAYFCLLGNAYVAAGRHEHADEAYEKAIAIDPPEAAVFYSRLAGAYSEAGRHEKAEGAIRHAVDRDAARPLLYCILGDILVSQGKPDDAREAYETAIEIDTGAAGAYYNRLAHVFARAGDRARAAAMFAKAIDADPLNHFYYVALSDVLRSAGHEELAAEIYDKARALGIVK